MQDQEACVGCAGTRTPTDMECRSPKSLVSSMHDLIGFFFSFQKMKTFSFVPSLFIMKRVHLFLDFTKERLGRGREPFTVEIVDTCLQAMQEGLLDACVQNRDGRYVWSCYTMTPDQWHRACGLLQRAGIGNLIFWGSKWFKYNAFMAGIEYLWTDLEAVEKFLMEWEKDVVWLVQEVKRLGLLRQELDRRRRFAWSAGLRRAWLVACTI